MTEAQWLACNHPKWMMLYLQKNVSSGRRFRIFAAACCRRIQHRLPDNRCREALNTCERYNEGLAGADELAEAYINADAAFTEYDDRNGWETAASAISCACTLEDVPIITWCSAKQAALLVRPRLNRKLEYRWQSRLLRDIFGNPFRPVTLNPSWLTPTVIALASGIYSEKAFDCMPILADALQDAGCDNEDILSHCRMPGEHVRGCWVVDLVLEKS